MERMKQTEQAEQMEKWDAYYENGTPANRVLVRGEAIPQGLYHLVAEVLVRHEDGSFLLMRRDLQKPNYPGYWGSGAGGSVCLGESAVQGAVRELWEETGLQAQEGRLRPIYWLVNGKTQGIYAGYCFDYRGEKDAVRLQEGETVDYRWVPANTFAAIIAGQEVPGYPFVPALQQRLRRAQELGALPDFNADTQ